MVGCQADFVHKHSIVLARLLESILELINYFLISEEIISKKIHNQKLVVWSQLPDGGRGVFDLSVYTQKYHLLFTSLLRGVIKKAVVVEGGGEGEDKEWDEGKGDN